ncbi:MAG: VOC family protein [Bosea sp. (in: a-proteobacteria)]
MEPTVYLFFNGNCLEAMTFYTSVLDGKVEGVFLNKDAPDAESRMPGGDHLVMNMAIRLGTATVMASDAADGWHEKPQGFAVSISPPSRAAFDKVFDGLAKDAQVITMPPTETFWADRFAMFTDRFGTPWMLNFAGSKAPAV